MPGVPALMRARSPIDEGRVAYYDILKAVRNGGRLPSVRGKAKALA